MKRYGDQLFADTAVYYSRYRPLYPPTLVRFLIRKFGLNGKGRLLDVGCGTGRLTTRFADWFDEIVGMDAEPEMVAEAERLGREARIENAYWIVGSAPAFPQAWADESFALVLMAMSFHWMDRDETLAALYPLVSPGGGIAIIDNYAPDKEPLPWETAIRQVVQAWLGEERRAGSTTYSHPELSHEAIVERSPFLAERYRLPEYHHLWTIDSYIGYLYSTSYASRRWFGDRAEAFEADVKDALLAVEPSGTFVQPTSLSVILAVKE